MFDLIGWATLWGVPLEAVRDLQQRIGVYPTDPAPLAGTSEAAVQNNARLVACEAGGRLWRNNNGAYRDASGAMVRYGLANESKAMNEILKSSDLIGIKPVLIGPEHVGHVIGQFEAVECKPAGWVYTGTAHERAQYAFGQLVIKLGGGFRFESGGGQ